MAEPLLEPLFKQKFEDQLTCAVCLDHYTNPKTLPCLHSFCLECIRRLPLDRKGNRHCLNCPTCRVEHPLPQGGAGRFPNAFHINSLLELRDDLARKETHSTSTRSKKREETSTVGDKASICPLHNDPLRIYCETCNRLICRDCAISSEHKKHKYNLIAECYPKHHQQIEGELRQVKSKITDIDKAIMDLTNRETAVDEQGEKLTMEIHQHAQQLIDIIHESERQLIQQVYTITQHKKEFLAKQKEAAGRVHSQLKTCEEMIEQNLREMSQEKVLMEKQDMIERMTKASEHIDPATFVPIEEANIKLKLLDFSFVENLAEVTSSSLAAVYLNSVIYKGKKIAAELTVKSSPDGSPFTIPPSAISCSITSSRSVSKELLVSKVSLSHNHTYMITLMPPSCSTNDCNLVVKVGGVEFPGLTIPFNRIGVNIGLFESYWFQLGGTVDDQLCAVTCANFLRYSRLSDGILHKIWDIADSEGHGYLDKQGFIKALRLVSVSQCGREPTLKNIMATDPLPRFYGLNEDIKKIKDSEQKMYTTVFDSLKPVKGLLSGDKVKSFLMSSNLSVQTLGKLWHLSDLNQDGYLDKDEFVIVMKLIVFCMRGNDPPETLPKSIIPAGKLKLAIFHGLVNL